MIVTAAFGTLALVFSLAYFLGWLAGRRSSIKKKDAEIADLLARLATARQATSLTTKAQGWLRKAPGAASDL